MDKRNNANHAININTLQNIIDYIELNIAESLSPSSISERFYISVSSVNILFRAVCDIAVMEYIRNRRLTLAGLELLKSNVRIIDLAFKYGYETPEAFAKAFSRFHGFPPSFVRRVYPKIRTYSPLKIKVEKLGGWDDTTAENASLYSTTDLKVQRHAIDQSGMYTELIKHKGEINMYTAAKIHSIHTKDTVYKNEWSILLQLAKKLDEEGIYFKVDGKTMLFAHGLDFKIDKICLTFMWNDEQRILKFFAHTGKTDKSFQPGFWYFDTVFNGMKIRCMSYGDCHPESNTKDFLYRSTDIVNADGQILHVQTVEFYLENADPQNDEFYQMVSNWAESLKQSE